MVKIAAGLLAVFGALALVSVGLYGVVAYSVNQRRPELGVRMAVAVAPVGSYLPARRASRFDPLVALREV